MAGSTVLPTLVQRDPPDSSSANSTAASFVLPNTDINGIGVVLAFLLSAFIPLAVALAFYIRDLIPPDCMNNFDTQFLKRSSRPSNRLMQGLRKGFLHFSIQQLILSISFLSTGIALTTTLTPFDFHTVIYMAWMSSTAHLATLFFLHEYFHSAPVYRRVELLSMLILLILLCVGLYPTTHWSWADSVLIAVACPDPAHCPGLQKNVHMFRQRLDMNNGTDGWSPQGKLTYLILVTSFFWQAASLTKWKAPVLKVFSKPLIWMGDILVASPHQATGERVTFTKLCRSTLLGVYLFLCAGLDVLGSFAFHITIAFFTLCWALMQILIARYNMLPHTIRPILDEWDFGQILPLILLLTPLYGVVEHFAGPPEETSASPPSSSFSSSSSHRDSAGLYSGSFFKVIVGLLSITVVGAGIGFYVESIVAYTGPSRPLTWITKDWHLLPDIIFTAVTLGLVFLLSVFGAFFFQRDIRIEQNS